MLKINRRQLKHERLEQQSVVNHRKYPFFTCDLYLGVKVTQNVAQYPLHCVTYAPAKFEVAMSTIKEEMYLQENTLYDLDLGSHKMLPSTLHIMLSTHLQNLKLLNQTV